MDAAPGSEAGTPRGGRALLLGLLAAALFSLGSLGVHASLLDASRLHIVEPFVDQLGYITTARRLLDEGEFRPGVLFPAFLESPHYRPYMPGHYLALAASYALFGWGTLASLLPSLLGHLVAVVAAFWIGNRLHGRAAGLVAAFAVAIFPPLVTYAFTAMAELTLIAASMLALALFVSLPARLQPWAMPGLLALPFFFRETGALFFLPMAALVLRPSRGSGQETLRRWRALAGAGLASVLLLYGMQAWQLASGKGALPFGTRIAEGSFNYGDAFAEPAPELSLGGWAGILATNTGRNLALFGETLRTAPLEPSTLGFLAIAAASALALGLGLRRREGFALATGLMGLVTVGLVFTVYDVKNERELRSTLFLFPPCAVALSAVFVSPAAARLRLLSRRRRALALGVVAFAMAGLLAYGWQASAATAENTRKREATMEPFADILAHLHGEDERVLVAPLALSATYLIERYPLLGASVPYNDETLALLLEKHRVGTLVVQQDWLGTNLSEAVLQQHFRFVVARGKFLFFRARS